MKYHSGQSLYFVDRYYFLIEKVKIISCDFNHNGYCLYYDDYDNVYSEEELFENLCEAILYAENLLDDFYRSHKEVIENYTEENLNDTL